MDKIAMYEGAVEEYREKTALMIIPVPGEAAIEEASARALANPVTTGAVDGALLGFSAGVGAAVHGFKSPKEALSRVGIGTAIGALAGGAAGGAYGHFNKKKVHDAGIRADALRDLRVKLKADRASARNQYVADYAKNKHREKTAEMLSNSRQN